MPMHVSPPACVRGPPPHLGRIPQPILPMIVGRKQGGTHERLICACRGQAHKQGGVLEGARGSVSQAYRAPS